MPRSVLRKRHGRVTVMCALRRHALFALLEDAARTATAAPREERSDPAIRPEAVARRGKVIKPTRGPLVRPVCFCLFQTFRDPAAQRRLQSRTSPVVGTCVPFEFNAKPNVNVTWLIRSDARPSIRHSTQRLPRTHTRVAMYTKYFWVSSTSAVLSSLRFSVLVNRRENSETQRRTAACTTTANVLRPTYVAWSTRVLSTIVPSIVVIHKRRGRILLLLLSLRALK